jgi:hypothetical protein
MASLDTIKEVVGFLAEVTGREVNRSLFRLWTYSFEDVKDEDLRAATIEYADTNRFFPTPKDIKDLMGESPRSRGLAWARISGFLSEKIEYGELDDMSKKMLEIMGGARHVKEQMSFKDIRISFFQMYDDVAEGEYAGKMRDRARLNSPSLVTKLLENKDV